MQDQWPARKPTVHLSREGRSRRDDIVKVLRPTIRPPLVGKRGRQAELNTHSTKHRRRTHLKYLYKTTPCFFLALPVQQLEVDPICP